MKANSDLVDCESDIHVVSPASLESLQGYGAPSAHIREGRWSALYCSRHGAARGRDPV